MKKLTLTIFIAAFALLFISCDSDINKVVMKDTPTKPVMKDLTITAAFTVANLDSLVRFSWDASDFGFQSSTTYSLQLSPTSDFGDKVVTLFSTQKTNGTAKVGDINSALLTWEKELGKTATVYYRIGASVVAGTTVYSDAKTKDFVPFETLIDYPMVYVPGAYQGWSPGNVNGRLYSYGFNQTYEGVLRLVDGTNANVEFKVTLVPNWNGTNYGGSLTKSGSNYSGTLDGNGGNLVAAAGVYKFKVNLSTKAIELTKTDDWGLIGSSIPPYDWSKDVDLFYNGQRKMWELTADLKAGEFKFRANDGWDLNYGDTGADGTLNAGGDNIKLTADGNYTIRFDPVKLTYTVKKN